MESISKSLRASAILIAISVGVPSAALATQDGTPEPSSTYTLTVPASDVGDDGSDVPLCFASLGMRVGVQPSGEGEDTSVRWETMNAGIGEGVLKLPGTREAPLAARLDRYSFLGDLATLKTDSQFEGNAIFVPAADGGFPYTVNAAWSSANLELAKELDSNQDGTILQEEESAADFDLELFVGDRVSVFYDASTCAGDAARGTLSISRGEVIMTDPGTGKTHSAEVENEVSFLKGILGASQENGQQSAVAQARVHRETTSQVAEIPRVVTPLAFAAEADNLDFTPRMIIANRLEKFEYSVEYKFWLETDSQ